VSGGIGELLDDFAPLIMRRGATIGTVMPHVLVEENDDDRLAITDHPVENGGTVSDHAFLLPKTCDLKIGWSDSKAGYVNASLDEYEALLSLQAEREPFDVSTGTRLFTNMLVQGVTRTHDQRTKNAVTVTVRLKEVRITGAQTAGQNIGSQASPQQTASQTNAGEIQGISPND
jgi:hypothetical protein